MYTYIIPICARVVYYTTHNNNILISLLHIRVHNNVYRVNNCNRTGPKLQFILNHNIYKIYNF